MSVSERVCVCVCLCVCFQAVGGRVLVPAPVHGTVGLSRVLVGCACTRREVRWAYLGEHFTPSHLAALRICIYHRHTLTHAQTRMQSTCWRTEAESVLPPGGPGLRLIFMLS